MPLRRQGEELEAFEFRQHAHGQLDAIAAGRRLPAEMLSDGMAEFGAAQLGEEADGLLDVGDLAAGEALAEEGGGLELLDAGVDGGCGTHPIPSWQMEAKKLSPCAEKTCRDANVLGVSDLQNSLGTSALATSNRMPLPQTRNQRRAAILRSVTGIGPKQAAALAGTAPFASDSGASHGPRHIRGGRPRPRKVLYMAGIAARRSNPDMRAFYQRLADQGKPHEVAITAVIRKLVVLANAFLRDDRLWQPQVPAKA